MWKKISKKNMNYWDVESNTYTLKKHKNNLDELHEQLKDNFEFAQHRDYYWEKQPESPQELPCGIYRYQKVEYDRVLVEVEIKQRESYIDLSSTHDVNADLDKFIRSKDIYKSLNMPARRGVLLYGPPGTGKTFTINNIISSIDASKCIVIFADQPLKLAFILALQKDERLKVVVFEEFTNCLGSDGYDLVTSDKVLDFLDGETSLDNFFVIATTNYPHKLPENIVKRPGRFDKFYKIGYLSRDDIQKYLEYYKLPIDECLLEQGEMTVAQLKEIVLLHKMHDLTFQEALDKLKIHAKLVENDFQEFKGRIGFNE